MKIENEEMPEHVVAAIDEYAKTKGCTRAQAVERAVLLLMTFSRWKAQGMAPCVTKDGVHYQVNL